MWPFGKPKIDRNQERPSLALDDMRERMDRLERKIRDIETDWASTYDKFHRLNMRLAKRAKLEEPAPEDPPREPNGPQPPTNPLAQALLARGRMR